VGAILLFLVILLLVTTGLSIAQWNLLGNEKYFAITLPLLLSALFGVYGIFLIRKGLSSIEEKPGTLDENELID
jgi:hypothetical protein